MPHISLAAERIGELWGLPVSNALLTTWVVMVLLILISVVIKLQIRLVPTRLGCAAEMIVGGLYDFFGSILGRQSAIAFPVVGSLFLFIISANWFGLLPGVGTIGFFHGEKFTPLFRGATADLNTTLALAIVAVVVIQFLGFKTLGSHYTSRFINLASPINFFVGLLELVSELSKVISFGFRLFGNIFAGEVLLTVVAFLMPFVVPLPFLFLELFVGFIQALVFSMLTAVFLNVAVSHGEEVGVHG